MVEVDDNEDLRQMIQETQRNMVEHRKEFSAYIEDWNQHRSDSAESARAIKEIRATFRSLSQNVGYLSQLPTIAANLGAMKDIQMQQTAGLLKQNSELVQSSINSQRLLTRLVIGALVLITVAMVVVLVRDSKKDVKADKNGISITTPAEQPSNR